MLRSITDIEVSVRIFIPLFAEAAAWSYQAAQLPLGSGLVGRRIAVELSQQRPPCHLIERRVAIGDDSGLADSGVEHRLWRHVRLHTAGRRTHLCLAGAD